MKYLISFFTLILSLNAFSQSGKLVWNITSANYRSDFNTVKFENMQNNQTFDLSIGYSFQIKQDKFFIQPELSYYERNCDFQTNFSNSKIKERIIDIPFLFKFQSTTKVEKLSMILAFGPDLSIVYNQQYYFPNGTVIPNTFTQKNNFAYSKIGIVAEIGFQLAASEKLGFNFSLKGKGDIKTFGKNEIVKNMFGAAGFNLGFYRIL